jgi:hypothetical protein
VIAVVDDDRYPASPRIQTLRELLNKDPIGGGTRAIAATETL